MPKKENDRFEELRQLRQTSMREYGAPVEVSPGRWACYCGRCLQALYAPPWMAGQACKCDRTPFGAIVSTRAWTQYQWDGIGDGGTPEEHNSIVLIFASQAEADAHYAAHPLKPADQWRSAETRADRVSQNRVQRAVIGAVVWDTAKAVWSWCGPKAPGARLLYRPEYLMTPDGPFTPEWEDGTECECGGTAWQVWRYGVGLPIDLPPPLMTDAQQRAYSALIDARAAWKRPGATYDNTRSAERIAEQVWKRVCAGDTLEAQLPHFPDAWRRLCTAADAANAADSIEARAECAAAAEAWDSMLALVPAEQWGRLADIADACGLRRTSLEELEQICDLPTSSDVHLLRIAGGSAAFEAQHRQEAGFFRVFSRPDKGTDVFSIQWRMPLVETAPGCFVPDPRSTVHLVHVESIL